MSKIGAVEMSVLHTQCLSSECKENVDFAHPIIGPDFIYHGKLKSESYKNRTYFKVVELVHYLSKSTL